MPRLTIPERYRDPLRTLVGWPDSILEQIVKACDSTQPSLDPDGFAERAADAVSEKPKSEVRVALQSLLSLRAAQAYLSMSSEELAAAAANSFDLKLSLDEADRLQQIILTVFKSGPFVVTAKAASVLTEHDKVYRGSRIMTDVRPIFLENPGVGPAAAVIVHTLKLTFRAGSRMEEFFIALDGRDIDDLQDTLNRAKEKESVLTPVLERSQIPYLETEENDK